MLLDECLSRRSSETVCVCDVYVVTSQSSVTGFVLKCFIKDQDDLCGSCSPVSGTKLTPRTFCVSISPLALFSTTINS